MGQFISLSANFTRPANTTAYAATDLVANSTVAGNVVPKVINDPRVQANGTHFNFLRRCILKHSQASVTSSNFKLWLLNAVPAITNGDNSVIAGPTLAQIVDIIDMDVDNLVTGAGAIGTAYFERGEIRLPSSFYFLIEANAAYTPASAEVFTAEFLLESE